VVCEVKTRANNKYGTPLEAMTRTKQVRVQRAGFAFVRALNEKGLDVRFDVAAIVGTQLEIIENAF
jgi:Holliday junction resolvase-like predicted endonuclease